MNECKHELMGTQYDPAECVHCGKTLVEILNAKIVELVAQNERLDMLYESAQDRAKQCRNKLRACKKRISLLTEYLEITERDLALALEDRMDAQATLDALLQAGVDNWEGYEEAMEYLNHDTD